MVECNGDYAGTITFILFVSRLRLDSDSTHSLSSLRHPYTIGVHTQRILARY